MYDLSLLYLPDPFIIDHIRSQDDVAGSGRLLRRAIAVLPACRLGPSRVHRSSNGSFVHLLPRSLLRSVAHRKPTVREPTPRTHPVATRDSRRSRSRLRAVTRQQSKRQRGGVEAFDMVTAGLDAGGRSIGLGRGLRSSASVRIGRPHDAAARASAARCTLGGIPRRPRRRPRATRHGALSQSGSTRERTSDASLSVSSERTVGRDVYVSGADTQSWLRPFRVGSHVSGVPAPGTFQRMSPATVLETTASGGNYHPERLISSGERLERSPPGTGRDALLVARVARMVVGIVLARLIVDAVGVDPAR